MRYHWLLILMVFPVLGAAGFAARVWFAGAPPSAPGAPGVWRGSPDPAGPGVRRGSPDPAALGLSTSPTAAPMPAVRFTDITQAAGIRFQHSNGAFGKKLLPETMGSGVAFLDYDGDGRQDILFVNSCSCPT